MYPNEPLDMRVRRNWNGCDRQRLRELHFQVHFVLRSDESPDAGQSHHAEHDAEGDADIAKASARGFAGRDAPLGGEQPDAVGEVPADGDHGDHVNGDHHGIGEFVLHFRTPRRGSQEADAHEALAQDMLDDVERSAMSPVQRCATYIQLPAQG